ncbi:MAG: hypothetical protein AB1689_18650 [Thermodesulfobacteriota bacterium]
MSVARRLRGAAAAAAVVLVGAGCSDAPGAGGSGVARYDSTRLCALVPARDPADAAFPPMPPVKVFGTDLGWTYEAAGGRVPILFGDTWQRIDVCPIQTNDDSLGELHLPARDWPGFTASASIPDEQCLDVTYAIDDAGTSFAPIVLNRWDGVPVPLGPLNTPVVGFWDGASEWAIFIVGGGQACTAAEAASGAPCPSELSPQAADLVCGTATGLPLCVDPTGTRRGDGAQAYYLHVAERVGPAAYVSRAMFLTNKYLNLTARTVRAFDPGDPRRNDYAVGDAALLIWGRPGFDDLAGDGELAPYFAWHPLPFRRDGERIAFAPRYLAGFADGAPSYASDQADAVPLYGGELEPVNHVAIGWVGPLARWLMIYGGSTTDYADPQRRTGRGQSVPGAIYARLARDPWGPWSEPTPIFTNEDAAQDLVCGHQAPAGCLPQPDPPIRPACIEAVDPQAGGNLYGANVIDRLTRPSAVAGPGPAADVFWNYSTWHPYSVVLVRTRVALE